MKHSTILLLLCSLVIAFSSCKKEVASSLQSETYDLTRHQKAADDARETMDITMSIEFPTSYSDAEVLENLQEAVMNILFDAPYSSMRLKEAMRVKADTLALDYQIDNASMSELRLDDDDTRLSPYFPAEYILEGKILGVYDDILSYQVMTYSYYGGAHGFTEHRFLNYSLNDNDIITVEDIFPNVSEKDLNAQLLSSFLAAQAIPADSLIEMGYELENIVVNDNFFLVEDSVVFHYNAYDIAPYCYGSTDIVIKR